MRLSRRKPSSLTRRWSERQRVVLLVLVSTNIAAFVAQLFVESYQPGIVRDFLGLSDRGVHDAYAWQFITAMFLHAGPWHLAGNMLVLYLLGRDVESILGQRHFLYLYLAGAVGGELGHLFLMPPDSVLLASSGGVAAVLVAYATILPELELTSIFFSIFPLRLKAKHLVYAIVLVGIVLLMMGRTGVVIHSAFLGGCAAGWLYAHLLGFGRTSLLQRFVRQRRTEAERLDRMSAEQFITEEIDPLLDKISRNGLNSLTRGERHMLARAREKIARQS
jgi:membrane associated rhomboid family serine protease